MARSVVVFLPHNPIPPLGGSHIRCLEMLTALVELGCSVTVFGSTMLSNTRWGTTASLAEFSRLGIDVELHRLTPFDYELGRLIKRAYRPFWSKQSVSPRLPSPPGMRERFADVLGRRGPDVVWMNYACWDDLLTTEAAASALRVVDTHDLITLNMQMQNRLASALRSARWERVPLASSPLLDESFYDREPMRPDPEEFVIYDRYHATIAITAKEAEAIARNTSRTSVRTIPLAPPPSSALNRYDECPVMVLGSHRFNLQGALYFTHRVLPGVLRERPGFRCRMTGRLGLDRRLPPSSALLRSGFVSELAPLYGGARFAICPVFGGTGQQVKIVEAMAHGLAPVALRAGTESSPIRHGENGWIADNADEFRDYTLRLWDDPGACRRMGEAARETIAREFSRSRLVEKVGELIRLPVLPRLTPSTCSG